MRIKYLFFLLCSLALPFLLVAQDLINQDVVSSLEELRWGITAYNHGRPGEALLALERAIALNPLDPLIREWLGRVYWRSGLEDAALEIWDQIVRDGEASAALLHQTETLRRRLNGDEELPVEENWVPLLSLKGLESNLRFFDRPAVVRPLRDGTGSLLVSSYAGGEIVLLNANGEIRESFDGGIEAFDRPFDILPLPDGRLLVSEFQADRISVVSMEKYTRGIRIASWGTAGRGEGQFLGPQYLALSTDGFYFYVSDWGNRRVAKWDLQGNQVLAMDRNTAGFPGFRGPSGIAVGPNRVYVADTIQGRIVVFDENGNYLGILKDEGLNSPGALSLDPEGRSLMVSDGPRLLVIDLVTAAMSDIPMDLLGGQRRITSLDRDENGNILLSDFDADEVVILSLLSTLYGGLEVILNQVKADTYPDMTVELTVRDRQGRGLVGLESSNFTVIDGEQRLGNLPIIYRGSTSRELELVTIADLSGGFGKTEELLQGIRTLLTSLDPTDKLSLVSAGFEANLLAEDASSVLTALTQLSGVSGPTAWDRALRLAGAILAPGTGRKVVTAFVASASSSGAFDEYGLRETARYLANNGITFIPLYFRTGERDGALDFLAKETGGSPIDFYRPEGLGPLIGELRAIPSGNYTLSWSSSTANSFGRAYLPVALEVTYIGMSGGAELGAFAPMR